MNGLAAKGPYVAAGRNEQQNRVDWHMTDMIGQDASPVFEYLRIIRRRKWLIGFVALLVIAGAVAAAFLLPATYESTATILIEEPGVSEELAGTNEVDFADQRLQLIQQRVMTTAKLIGVIDRLGLYEEVREITPVNILADNLRRQVVLQLVGAEATSTQNNRNRATTAFTLSFTARNPITAQAVTEELVDLYLKENERTQRDRALGTAGFLTAESSRLAAQIKDLEAQLAQFKTEHAGSLPEELEFNMQLLDRNQTQLLEFMRQAQGVRERQAFLQAQLLSLEPQAPINSNAPETLSPRSRLRLLTSQYGALNAKYGPNHPDVVSLRRQIESLNGSVDDGASLANVQELQASLAVAQEKYGKAHPEVVSLQRQIDAAQKAGAASGPAAVVPDNPAYVQTQGQLNALGSELGMASAQIASLQEKIKEVEARVLKTPEVERAYVALKRDYDTAVAKYQDLQERESQAELAKNLETEQMGERLSLIEPPPLPIDPTSPNRPAIILLGIVVGLAAGIAAGFLAESLDGRIYGHRGVAAIIGEPPLAFVPRIHTVHDRRTGRQKFAVVMASAILVATTLIVGAGLDLTSLESFWSSLQDQWGKS